MKCPRCHNENKYDSLTCDFCMAELPMTKERIEEIKTKKALERKAKFKKSMTVIIGMGAAVILIIAFVIGYLISKNLIF